MWWIIGGAGVALGCYILGYVMGSVITSERINKTRGELELDEGCFGCKDIGLPCDPNCKRKEKNEDEQSEKNISESDEA